MNMPALPAFDRKFLEGAEPFTMIGSGSLGGKARGLIELSVALQTCLEPSASPGVEVYIPRFAVIGTDLFDLFLKENDLYKVALSGASDPEITREFHRASLPVQLVGDLHALVSHLHVPLAVRSSSLLEDAIEHPMAGVYATKMTPNNQYDSDIRFRKLVEAIKLVWASTFFASARGYLAGIGRDPREEKMAVMIQELVGLRRRDRFHPDLAGVARSYNFYPTGHARPREGVVSLALGLGKTIVDGGRSWTYSPAYPRANPPYNSIRDLMQQTQTDYWAVNMGPITDYDPLRESEYLIKVGLEEAEEDGLLAMTASSYDHEADRLVPHLDRPGPRVVTFAPLLVNERVPLNRALVALLACCEHAAGTEVEIEFAVNLPQRSGEAARLGFLQVRPLLVSEQTVEIAPEDLEAEDVLVSSDSALGNGSIDSLVDIVYVKPETFDSAKTRAIAAQIEEVNRALLADNRRYVLIGFGRWGTSDPWLGIPITWGQISGARAIVESSLPQVVADPSQGSHFFHNVTSLRIFYLSAGTRGRGVQWDWLRELPAISDTEFVRHVRVESPLVVRVDGRSGRGLIAKTRTVRPS